MSSSAPGCRAQAISANLLLASLRRLLRSSFQRSREACAALEKDSSLVSILTCGREAMRLGWVRVVVSVPMRQKEWVSVLWWKVFPFKISSRGAGDDISSHLSKQPANIQAKEPEWRCTTTIGSTPEIGCRKRNHQALMYLLDWRNSHSPQVEILVPWLGLVKSLFKFRRIYWSHQFRV